MSAPGPDATNNQAGAAVRTWLTCREAPDECAEKFQGRSLAEASRSFYAHVAEAHRARGGVSS